MGDSVGKTLLTLRAQESRRRSSSSSSSEEHKNRIHDPAAEKLAAEESTAKWQLSHAEQRALQVGRTSRDVSEC